MRMESKVKIRRWRWRTSWGSEGAEGNKLEVLRLWKEHVWKIIKMEKGEGRN